MEEQKKSVYAEYMSCIELLSCNKFSRIVIAQYLLGLNDEGRVSDGIVVYDKCCEKSMEVAKYLKSLKGKTQELVDEFEKFHDLLVNELIS